MLRSLSVLCWMCLLSFAATQSSEGGLVPGQQAIDILNRPGIPSAEPISAGRSDDSLLPRRSIVVLARDDNRQTSEFIDQIIRVTKEACVPFAERPEELSAHAERNKWQKVPQNLLPPYDATTREVLGAWRFYTNAGDLVVIQSRSKKSKSFSCAITAAAGSRTMFEQFREMFVREFTPKDHKEVDSTDLLIDRYTVSRTNMSTLKVSLVYHVIKRGLTVRILVPGSRDDEPPI